MALRVAGIDKWAAGIRHRMANDPGRQDLDDHILCNGFLFLDEYMEDILIGARSETIIELTKTPGRRKDTSKKDRVATTASVKTLQSSDKENVPALHSPTRAKKAPTSFQKALLKASRENQPEPFSQIPDTFISDSQNPFGSDDFVLKHADDVQEEEAVAVLITPPSTRMAACTESKEFTLSPSLSANGLPKASDKDFGPSSPPNPAIINKAVELSVIAEGDENEMSRRSLVSIQPTGPIIHEETSYHIPANPNNVNGAMSPVAASYDLNADDDDDTQAFPPILDRTFNDSEPTSTASSFPIDPYARDYETYELPQVVAEHAPTEPSHPHSPPAPTLIRKASVPVFPSLPGPSPLRKSTRDSVVGGSTVGNARSSVTTGTGTRSSWLNKARDVTAKRASVVSGVKRKSVDLTDYTTATGAYVRGNKVAKMWADGGVSDVLSDAEKPQGKLAIQPFKAIVPPNRNEQPHELPVAHVATPDGNSEGMMNILKRTVEGLGARVGKSMGKSLGGAAAAAAAAEAKAAAEARLAQREAKGSDGTRQGRLSVSDLVGAFESGEVVKGNERESSDSKLQVLSLPLTPTAPHVAPGSRTSISTTPLNSPRLSGYFEPHDESREPGNNVQQDDMGSDEAKGESGFGSSDAAEPKLKAGSSQENSTTSIQPGLVAQASTLLSKVMGSSVSSALSGSKRSKPEPVKSIQLAAAAAKKQQEEADRKAARLREMDKRRAAIASKKADQDATERSKQQGDRHKREREEAPERNPKTTVKGEEEASKKRKVVVEIEKKPQNRKALNLKDKKELGNPRFGKPMLNTSLSQPQLASSGPSKMFKPLGVPASASQPSIKLVGPNLGGPKPVALPKVGPNGLEDIRQPSQTLHAQMQARVQAQLLQARQEEPLVPSESIELPDINSEYSNSDDEDRPRTFDPPDWAQSPVLGLALQSQSRLNPDDIFGPVRPLRMEEIFTTRHSRFRARTSSANWAGTDELTTDEQRQYAKRMGYID